MNKGIFDITPIRTILKIVREHPDIEQVVEMLETVDEFIVDSMCFYETVVSMVMDEVLEKQLDISEDLMEELVGATSRDTSAVEDFTAMQFEEATKDLVGVN